MHILIIAHKKVNIPIIMYFLICRKEKKCFAFKDVWRLPSKQVIQFSISIVLFFSVSFMPSLNSLFIALIELNKIIIFKEAGMKRSFHVKQLRFPSVV